MRRLKNGYAILIIVATTSSSFADDAINARVSVANATFEPQVTTKQMLVPKELEYAIEVGIRCADKVLPRSLSLGVADTRIYFDLADPQDKMTIESSFSIPGTQIAPLVTQGYCLLDDTSTQKSVLVRDVLTAQLSLRCGDGPESTIHYLSQPLAIRLTCTRAEEDQEESSSTDR